MTHRSTWLLSLTIGALWAAASAFGLLEAVDRLAYDARMRLQPDPPVSPQILVVAYDEPSLQEMHWPWPRDTQGQLLDRLKGAKVVLFDVLLAEPDLLSPQADLALVAALKRHPRVFLAATADPDHLLKPVLPAPDFLKAARRMASVRVVGDADGIVRKTALSFPLTTESDAVGAAPVPDRHAMAAAGSDSLPLMSAAIARQAKPDVTLPAGPIYPNFRRDLQPITAVSAFDVLMGAVPDDQIRDRIVLVGATAQGMHDYHILPSGQVPGIYYQAQVISSLLHGDWRQPMPTWAPPLLVGLWVAVSLLVWDLLAATVAAPLFLIGFAALGSADWLVWLHGRTWLPTAAMIVASLLSLLLLGLGRQILLTLQLRQVVRQLLAAFDSRDVRFASQSQVTPQAQPRRQPIGEQIQSLVSIANAFHEEWRFLQTLIETNRNPVLVVDPQRQVILSNSAGTDFFGAATVGSPLLQMLGQILDEDGMAEFEAVWASVHAGQTDVSPPLIQREGQALELNVLPLTGGRGTLCLFEDVTALHRRANTDGLTGLWNRRYFDEKLANEIARFERYGREHPVGLIIIDIDHFKKVNDTYGHQVGDQVIKMVAAQLANTVRTTDLPVRYGGEEMCVLLTHTDLEGSLILAERLREGIARMEPHDTEGKPFKVTASFGVAVSLAKDTPKALIERADQALYRSKENGRNRVTAGDHGNEAVHS